jgi:hypothetical protein
VRGGKVKGGRGGGRRPYGASYQVMKREGERQTAEKYSVSNCTHVMYTLWKKPFCFSFPPENSRIKNRKSRCRYQNNLSAAHRVFLNYPCQKSYGRPKNPGQKQQISPENPGLLVSGGRLFTFPCRKR